MNKKINFSIPFSKVDEDQRTVTGIATAEVLDKQNEIVDYEASKKAFSEWGGNIREMHGDKAIGKSIDIQFDDENKAIILSAKLSESADGENAWIKCKEGVLTGFSIGGSVFDVADEVSKSADGKDVNARRIKGYNLAETSLVDSPACPVAQFLMVKSENGKLEEVDKMIENEKPLPVLGWQKAFIYSIDQYEAFKKSQGKVANAIDIHEFAKGEDLDIFAKKDYSDSDRKDMASSGEALPDGSFPIKNVQDLKNAIKAIGRAKDPAKAKAHIKKRAKALGQTALIPDTWKAEKTDDLKKADEPAEEDKPNVESPEAPSTNPQGDENNNSEDNENKEELKPEGDKQTVTTPPVEPPADTDKSVKNNDLRKDLYTVSSFADCLSQLVCIRDWCLMEQEWENDDSTVPAELTVAIETLGGILQSMAAEEVQEANDKTIGTPAETLLLDDKPTDLKKIEDQLLSTTQTMLDKQAEMLIGKVAELVKPLADRVNSLEHQPATNNRPTASFFEIDKGAGNPKAPNDPIADQNSALSKRWTELKEIASSRKNDPSFSLSDRQKLVDEMWKVNKQINHVTTADMDPSLVNQYPYAFKKMA
jgi:hypothetical protein